MEQIMNAGWLVRAIAALAVVGTSRVATASDVFWIDPAGGSWDDGANWSTGSPPAAADRVFISVEGAYSVSLRGTRSVSELQITNHTATLRIEGSPTPGAAILNVANGIRNEGILLLAGSGSFGARVAAEAEISNIGAINSFGTPRTIAGAVNNTGTITASGILTITGSSVTHHNTGSIRGPVTFAGPGCTLVNSGRIELGGSTMAWDQMQVLLEPGTTFGGGGLVWITSSSIALGADMAANSTYFHFESSTVVGPGTLIHSSFLDFVRSNTIDTTFINPGAELRLFAQSPFESLSLTITHHDLINDGTITMDNIGESHPSVSLSVTAGGRLLNSGTINVARSWGGSRSINGAIINGGVINVGGDMSTNAYSSNTVNSGTLNVAGGDWQLLNSSGRSFVNSGAVNVQAGRLLQLTNTLYVQTAGVTTVNGTLRALTESIAFEGGLMNGGGTVTGNVNNSGGLLSPGLSAGVLAITGNYTQGSAGTLLIEIGGPDAGTRYDQLNVSGDAQLDGALSISRLDGYVPERGRRFRILTFATSAGRFASIAGSDAGAGNEFKAVYCSAGQVLLVVGNGAWLPCDANCDGCVNSGDIDAFVIALVSPQAYAATFPECDRTGNNDANFDGAVNGFDIDAFVECLAAY
jgi:hypothetical protein